MKIFFDTETTGKPKDYKRPMWDVENYPRVVQLGFIVVDDDGSILFENEFLIKPEGYTIPEEVTKIHGISQEKAAEFGVPIVDALQNFLFWLNMCDEVVGHNVQFDINCLGAEFWRLYSGNPFLGKKETCTMRLSTNFCGIPSPFKAGTYKFPQLGELYRKLFNDEMGQAHTALQDIRNTLLCYHALVEKGIIK